MASSIDPRTQALIDSARTTVKQRASAPKVTAPTTVSGTDDSGVDERTLAFINASKSGTLAAPTTSGGGYRPSDPSVSEAVGKVRDAKAKAIQAGVDPGKADEISKGGFKEGALKAVGKVINFDIIPGKGKFKPIEATVIKPLEAIDLPRRVIISGLNEAVDLLPGGEKASWGDFVNQSFDPTYGFGTAFANPTGNKWADRLIGFAGDVLLDPVTYLTLGGGTIAKTAAAKGAQLAAREAGSAAAVRGAKILADEAARTAALGAKKLAKESLDQAVKQGDDLAIAAAKESVKRADEALKQATSKVTAATGRRQYRRTGRETLAEQVRQVRQEALREASDDTLDATSRAAAQAVASTLTDDVIGEIATKGYNAIRGEVADVLGVQSGLRLNLPGARKFVIPGTQKVTDAIGTRLVNTRLNLVNSEFGSKVLDKITPMGRAGLFGDPDILMMRTALSKGTAKGATAVDYVAMLAADGRYRRGINAANAAAGAKVATLIGKGKEELNSIVPFLDTPESQWAARGLTPTPEQLQLISEVRRVTDDFYNEANVLARSVGGADLPYSAQYFPHAQSEEAIRWVERNSAKADNVAEGLGIDRTFMQQNFVERTLQPGKIWFGKELTQADIDGGVRRLNQIAKDSGQINFNFFTEDFAEAMGRYAQKHARYVSYMDTIKSLQDPVVGALETTRPTAQQTFGPAGVRAVEQNLDALKGTLATAFTPSKLVKWSPEQFTRLRTALDDLSKRLDADTLVGQEFNDAILTTDEIITSINREIQRGNLLPETGALLANEAEAYAMALRNQLDNVSGKFKVVEPKRWKSIVRVVEDGYRVLNPERIPDIAVREEVADMFTNIQKLNNPKFAESAEKLLADYNTFFKSWVTATPGFHLRNALGNTMASITAGGNPKYVGEGIVLYGKFLKSGKTPQEFVQGLKISSTRKKAIEEAFSAVSPGQFGEVIGETGTAAGVFGRTATGRIRGTGIESEGLRRASVAAGSLPRWSRKGGQIIEDAQRFALTYDGLQQGMDIAGSAARTNKFMVDYTDLSQADRVIKQVIPFWMWMSRNAPLQIENMWMNPRVYQTYNNLRRNYTSEDESPYIPSYLKEAGAFQLAEDIPGIGGALVAPDLGFPGAGRPSPLLAFETPRDLAAGISPIGRVPLEVLGDTRFFSGLPITNEYASLDPETQKWLYALQQFGAPLSTFGRFAGAIPGTGAVTQGEVPAALLGTRQAYGETEAEKQRAAEENRARALASILGLPIRPLLPSEERAELTRRRKELEEQAKRAQNNK